MIETNKKIPNALVSYLKDGEIEVVKMCDLFEQGVYILVGVPGAFTPICTKDHLPTLIEKSDRIRKHGVADIYCISDDNPWALDAWRQTFNNNEKIKFLSDGNRDFLSEMGLCAEEDFLFLKGKYARFYALIEDGYIKLLRVEKTVLDTSCTNGGYIETDLANYA